MSIDWYCPECGVGSRLASDTVRVHRWSPKLRAWLPRWVCRECASDQRDFEHPVQKVAR